MNKITTIAVVAMIAGAACADLSVEWRSQTGAIAETDGGTDFLVGSTIELIWSPNDAITTAGAYDLVALEAANSFYVLSSEVTGANSTWSGFGGVFDNTLIGGNDINTGFFYTRIFQNDGSAGENFMDYSMGAGASFVFNSLDAATTFKDNVTPAGTGNWIGDNNTTVVPEPATIGLFGLGALSAWIIRRNKQKATEVA